MYLGLRLQDKYNETWKINLRLLRKTDQRSDIIAELIENKMTDGQKLMILEIKSQVHQLPGYHKTFSSVDIYEAVIENEVVNLEQFKKYLQKKNKKVLKLLFIKPQAF